MKRADQHTDEQRPTYSTSDATASQWIYLACPPEGDIRLGMSLSGGGIRSAAFSLGAVQRLTEDGIFNRVEHLASVSGGTYLAGGLSITAKESEPSALRDAVPWSRGSPEERRLRLETTYLASGWKDSVWLTSNYIYGLVVNLVTLAVGMFIAGRLLGTLLSPLVDSSGESSPDATAWLATIALGAIAVSVLLVGVRRLFDKPGRDMKSRWLRILRIGVHASWTVAAGAAFVLFLVPLLDGLHTMLDWISDVTRSTDYGWGSRALRFGLAVAIMFLFALFGGAAIWLGRRTRSRWFFSPIALIAGPGLLLTPALLAVDRALYVEAGLRTQLPELGLAVVALVTFGILAHNRRYSLHLFYRERLHHSFAVKRTIGDDGKPQAHGVPYTDELLLSELGDLSRRSEGFDVHIPNTIYCAAVATARREAPYRRNAESYTFEADWSGGPRVGYAPTTALEGQRGAGGSELTLPSVMAISGAAISPLMGRFSEPALRFLLAMLNLRLGVWLPHPLRNPSVGTGNPQMGKAIDQKAESASGERRARRPLHRRAASFVVRGWREPGALYVLYEALGIARTAGRRYVFLTDGGHWENLGLVELLRRRCSHVIIVDASSSAGALEEEIARAARLLGSELGIEMTADLSRLTRSPGSTPLAYDDLPEAPIARGEFTYPDGVQGRFILIRLTLWKDAPFELKALRLLDPQFPHHPTRNQFFSGEQFDAYRQLGWTAAGYVKDGLPLPPRKDPAVKPRRLLS